MGCLLLRPLNCNTVPTFTPIPYTYIRKITLKCDFSCISAKIIVPLHREPAPGDVCTSSAEGSRHNKRRLLRSVPTLRNVAVSKYLQDLATIDALRDIDYPSRAYLVRHLRILCITHTRSLTMI